MRKEKSSVGIPLENKEAQVTSHSQRTTPKRWPGMRMNRASSNTPVSANHSQQRKRPLPSVRAGLAVIGGRTAGALSRRLHLGGGTSIAGIVAQRLDPNIVEHLGTELQHGSILVTGTNGKTTTSSFIAAILSDAGLRVWRNREGSNLMRGIAGSLVIRARPNGHLRRSGQAISILETDEAVVGQISQLVPPRVAVFTNLFRDQLDRYGEVDSVATLWQQAISALTDKTTLVLNADDPATANLGEAFAGQILYFGIDDPSLDIATQANSPERHQVIDSRTCPHCGGEYTYTLQFYSHMGHYECPNCGYSRPQPDVRVLTVLHESFDRLRIVVETPSQKGEIVIPLPGLYNIYNALAAITTAHALGIGWEPIVTGIEQFKPAFGRGERVQVEGRTIRLLLAKNPTGANEVLRTLFTDETQQHVLFILNDNTADGRDISWIWDVDFERGVGKTKTIVVAGTRALDLALRLKYAKIAQQDITIVPPAPLRAAKQGLSLRNRAFPTSRVKSLASANVQDSDASSLSHPITHNSYGIAAALNVAISQTPIGETLFVVPTYTGLLEVHSELEKRGLTPHYWEGQNI